MSDITTTQPFTQELITVVQKLPPAQATQWLNLAIAKNTLTATLTKMELECQAFLIPITPAEGFDPKANIQPGTPILPYMEQEKVEAGMNLYKAKQKEMTAERLKFTNVIKAGLIDKLMEPEKRMDPATNAAFKNVSNHELQLRLANQAKTTAATNLANEKVAFKTHFENEYMGIDVDFQLQLDTIIFDTYQNCLIAKTPIDGVPAAISVAKLAMQECKMKSPNRFQRQFMTPEDAELIFNSLPKPDAAKLLSEGFARLSEKFSLYSNDLQNIPVAIQTVNEERSTVTAESTNNLKTSQAANTLYSNAVASTVVQDDRKGVTELTRIVILDSDPNWVSKIMTAFLKDFNTCFLKVRVSKFSNLNVRQMAEALDAAGIKVTDVTYETIQK